MELGDNNNFYEKTGLVFNPFEDSGILSYEQFKKYPFIIVGNLKEVNEQINARIWQIKDKNFFGSRVILIGNKGIGKTSALFHIKDILENNNIKNFVFSNLIEDFSHFTVFTKEKLELITQDNPVFILIDFPDSLDTAQYKKFLQFLWNVMSHENQSKINLIFSM